MARRRSRWTRRTSKSCPRRRNALILSRSTKSTLRFANGARRNTRGRRSSGNGIRRRRPGTGTTTATGITGGHPRMVSLKEAGPGTTDTGTMMGTPSSTKTVNGTDSKTSTGSLTAMQFLWIQSHQPERKSADHSINWWNRDSLQVWHQQTFLAAKLVTIFTCGRMMLLANSSEVSNPIKSVPFARAVRITNGRGSLNVPLELRCSLMVD